MIIIIINNENSKKHDKMEIQTTFNINLFTIL